MSHHVLADFLEDAAQSGELLRVETACDPTLEAIAATRQSLLSPALPANSAGTAVFAVEQRSLAASASITDQNAVRLWTAIGGLEFPILENLFGSVTRICRTLGVPDLGALADRVTRLVESPGEPGGWKKILGRAAVDPLGSFTARKVRSAACQQIVRLGTDVDLRLLPFLRTAGPESPSVVFAAPVLSADPETGQIVGGRFDLQQLDRQRLAVRWADGDEPARLLREYRNRGEKMPVAIVFGGDPAFLLAAAAVLPIDVDALAVAGLLCDKPLEVIAGRTVELPVPAEAELVLEGYIDPLAPGDSPGAEERETSPVIHATAITHRSNPVLPVWLPGAPPYEAIVTARALQRIFLPLLTAAIPELVDCDFPAFGAARRWATLAVRTTYPGQVRRIAHAARAIRPFWDVSWLVLVDAEVDVHDTDAVLAAVAHHARPVSDLWNEPDQITVDATRKTRGSVG
ncbi:MAG: UbiD family decarboxylase [Pirellulales bacterium]|nr:UbiD family decarboxylase [Pirellulales bacterium]